MKPKDGFMYQDNGKPWLTDKNEQVPMRCPKCGEPMRLKLRGEPVFICDDNHYFGTLKFPEK
jgi:hypothetical protein